MKRTILMACAAVSLALGGATMGAPSKALAQGAPGKVYVLAGHVLVDPASGKVEDNKTLVIVDGRVAEIRDGRNGGSDGETVDLRDSFVLPGLIDTHVHILGQNGPSGRLDAVTRTNSREAIDGAMYALRTLRAGITTVADVGDDNEAIFALRDGINAGEVPGPRILSSGHIITPHGGRAGVRSWRPGGGGGRGGPAAGAGAGGGR